MTYLTKIPISSWLLNQIGWGFRRDTDNYRNSHFTWFTRCWNLDNNIVGTNGIVCTGVSLSTPECACPLMRAALVDVICQRSSIIMTHNRPVIADFCRTGDPKLNLDKSNFDMFLQNWLLSSHPWLNMNDQCTTRKYIDIMLSLPDISFMISFFLLRFREILDWIWVSFSIAVPEKINDFARILLCFFARKWPFEKFYSGL